MKGKLGNRTNINRLIVASTLISETQVIEQRIFSFGIKEQLMVMLQNVNDVNKTKERTRFEAVSSVCVTRPNIMVS